MDYKATRHRCDLTVCGQCTPACLRPAATSEQQLQLSMNSVHAADDSEVELLCLDHMSPAVLLRHSSDLESSNLYRQIADELLVVPVINK